MQNEGVPPVQPKFSELRIFFYTYDPFKKWSHNPEIENLPLIHKWIYKKIFISGLPRQKCGFFTNKRTPADINFISKNFAGQTFFWVQTTSNVPKSLSYEGF